MVSVALVRDVVVGRGREVWGDECLESDMEERIVECE